MTSATLALKCPNGHKIKSKDGTCYRCLNEQIRAEIKADSEPVRRPKPAPVKREPKPEVLPLTLVQFIRNLGNTDSAPCPKKDMEAARELCQLAYQVVGDDDPGSCLSKFVGTVCEKAGRERGDVEGMTIMDALRSLSRYKNLFSVPIPLD